MHALLECIPIVDCDHICMHIVLFIIIIIHIDTNGLHVIILQYNFIYLNYSTVSILLHELVQFNGVDLQLTM